MLDDIRVRTDTDRGQTTHVVTVYQVANTLLAAREREGRAGNQEKSAGTEVSITIFQVLKIIRREPTRNGKAAAAAHEFEKTFAAVGSTAWIDGAVARAQINISIRVGGKAVITHPETAIAAVGSIIVNNCPRQVG